MAQKRDRLQDRLVQEQLWRERVEVWRGSGLTQVEFCRASRSLPDLVQPLEV